MKLRIILEAPLTPYHHLIKYSILIHFFLNCLLNLFLLSLLTAGKGKAGGGADLAEKPRIQL